MFETIVPWETYKCGVIAPPSGDRGCCNETMTSAAVVTEEDRDTQKLKCSVIHI